MYELWMTQGQGGGCVAEYATEAEGLKALKEGIERKDGSYSLKHGNKSYYGERGWFEN